MGKPRFNNHWNEVKPCTKYYTPKQLSILNEEIPLELVRLTDISAIIRRANARGDSDFAELATELYNRKKDPYDYTPPYTVEESKAILQSLTPWTIKWYDDPAMEK